jgi:hypothetical protein
LANASLKIEEPTNLDFDSLAFTELLMSHPDNCFPIVILYLPNSSTQLEGSDVTFLLVGNLYDGCLLCSWMGMTITDWHNKDTNHCIFLEEIG